MKLEDETLLTAYLDGELDAAGRNLVEAAINASPGVARRLRDLAEARDLVEGLSRPAARRDLSEIVVRRLDSPVSPWAFRIRVGRVVAPRWLVAGSTLSAAAALVMCLTLADYRKRSDGMKVASAPAGRPGRSSTHDLPKTPAPTDTGTDPRAEVPGEGEILASGDGPTPTEADRAALQERFRRLLEGKRVRKVSIPIERRPGRERSLDRLQKTIEETPRKEAETARLTVDAGLGVDPSAPQGATVFGLVVSDREYTVLVRRLAEQFGGVPRESTPSPSELMFLADLRDVSFFEGRPAGMLAAPPAEVGPHGEMALKKAPEPPRPVADPGASLRDPLSPPLVRRPRPTERTAPGEAIEARADDGREATVLVWLVPRRPATSSRRSAGQE